MNLELLETCTLEKIFKAMACVPEIVVGRLVYFPFVRHDHQKAPACNQRSRQLPQDAMRLAHMLECHDVDARPERAIAKR